MTSRVCLCAILLALSGTSRGGATQPGKSEGFALVELFTSEGCSSCPPADELLARLAADAGKSGHAVYCLSFHVDYWDGLGWKDPYSNPEFTRRQEQYETVLGVRGPYTPQIVVNGTEQFVGSDRSRAEKSIAEFLSQKAPVSVRLQASIDGRSVAVEWKVTDATPASELHVVWAQAEAASNPDRGENASRKLRHVHVVRALRTIQLGTVFEGHLTLTPPELRPGSVIAFVQDVKTGRILGAAARDVTNER